MGIVVIQPPMDIRKNSRSGDYADLAEMSHFNVWECLRLPISYAL